MSHASMLEIRTYRMIENAMVLPGMCRLLSPEMVGWSIYEVTGKFEGENFDALVSLGNLGRSAIANVGHDRYGIIK